MFAPLASWQALRKWLAEPTFGPRFRYWRDFSKRQTLLVFIWSWSALFVGRLVIQKLGVESGTGPWILVCAMVAGDGLCIWWAERRARRRWLERPSRAGTDFGEPIVMLPPPPIADRKRAALKHAKWRRNEVMASAGGPFFSIFLGGLALGNAISDIGTRGADQFGTQLMVVVVSVWIFGGSAAEIYIDRKSASILIAGEREWWDALDTVATPVSRAIDNLRRQVEQLRSNLDSTITQSDELERMLSAFDVATRERVAGFEEMEAASSALQVANDQDKDDLALTLDAIEQVRRSIRAREKRRDRFFDISIAAASLSVGFLLSQIFSAS